MNIQAMKPGTLVGSVTFDWYWVTVTYPLFLVAAVSSFFSVGPQDLSSITTPRNSQTRSEEPKLPESETLSRMASNISNSTTIVADLTDDLGTSSRTCDQGWVAIPRGHGLVLP